MDPFEQRLSGRASVLYGNAGDRSLHTLNCPSCRTQETYTNTCQNEKAASGGADEPRPRKLRSNQLHAFDGPQAMCKNPRAAKRFDISGKTSHFS